MKIDVRFHLEDVMDELGKKLLADLVREYPINDLLIALQEAIDNQVDQLVDANAGHSGMVKEMSRVAHHLAIFARD
jgi:predicted RecB family endonuclease